MNVQPNPAAASIAGVSRAAARGGEHEKQVAEAAQQQQTAEAPAGKTTGSPALDAGEQTSDRGGDGRQTYDQFERSEPEPTATSEDPPQMNADAPADHLDLRG